MTRQKFSFDLSIFVILVLIISMSILALYSAGYNKPVYKNIYLTQFLWFVIGLVLMLAIIPVNFKKVYNYAHYIYLITILLLIITALFGREIRHTRGWLTIGPINFQFSEIAKIATILFLAKYIDYHYREFNKFKDFIFPFLILLFPIFLILLQPDLGSTLVFFPVFFVMIYLADANIKYLIYIMIIGAITIILPLLISYFEFTMDVSNIIWIKIFKDKSILFPLILLFFIFTLFFKIIYKFYPKQVLLNAISNILIILLIGLLFSYTVNQKLKTYQKKRLLVFVDPEIDPYGTGYNIIQSKIAIGSGKLFGKGYLQGSQTQLGFLPEQTTDFIISVIGEEFGWLGMSFVLLLYFLLIVQALKIVYNARDPYSSLIATGISTMFIVQIFINVGMTLGIMPVTGIPLPFLSYGGSSLITSMIGAAILINIKTQR
ncbi:MAG: rod shape-determining protein RodA [Spirochaetes bacterium]|nr:rod shape-determining protein RodA [Spirochaetota bacterium]